MLNKMGYVRSEDQDLDLAADQDWGKSREALIKNSKKLCLLEGRVCVTIPEMVPIEVCRDVLPMYWPLVPIESSRPRIEMELDAWEVAWRLREYLSNG